MAKIGEGRLPIQESPRDFVFIGDFSKLKLDVGTHVTRMKIGYTCKQSTYKKVDLEPDYEAALGTIYKRGGGEFTDEDYIILTLKGYTLLRPIYRFTVGVATESDAS